jgi:hypothetical protein
MVVDPRFEPIIKNLQDMFGDRLELLSTDQEWLNFRVKGMTETALILQLQQQPDALLGTFWREFQVLTPLNARRADGISVRWVGVAALMDRIQPGFWFS